jgi:hypothetical protein
MTDVLDRLKTASSDRYAKKHEIGRGGTATVYLAPENSFATPHSAEYVYCSNSHLHSD